LGEGSDEDHLRLIAIDLLEGRHAAAPNARALRLDGGSGPVGVLVLDGQGAHALDPAYVTAFGGMVALALERAILSEQVAERRAAARAEELKSAILSSVSHDFRTPLTAISASASSLLAYRDKLEPEVAQGFLRRIVDDCDRLNRYTANLLELSKLETGGGQGLLQTLDVTDMLSVAVQRLRSRAGRRKISLVTSDNELPVAANPALFELVLINVLENAILYSPDATSIVVAASQMGDCCRISIADEGCGIPTADLERVFERFVRVRRSEASPQGSGLGLAIARGFVEALGGSIAARTPGLHGRGTEVVIELPLVQESLLA
jgi:two-component system sensor histidine kinase KdpD